MRAKRLSFLSPFVGMGQETHSLALPTSESAPEPWSWSGDNLQCMRHLEKSIAVNTASFHLQAIGANLKLGMKLGSRMLPPPASFPSPQLLQHALMARDIETGSQKEMGSITQQLLGSGMSELL